MKAIRLLAFVLAGFAVAGIAFAQEVRVGYWSSGSSAAIGLVMENGKFLEAEGLKPTWIKIPQLADLNRALISKSVDFVLSDGTLPALRLSAEHVPAKIILANLIADANFVVPENSPIKSIEDLRGKKIGSTPPGSTMYALIHAILKDGYGMSDKDIKQVPSGEAQLFTFLQRGDIDAAVMRSITLRTLGPKAKFRVLGSVPDEWKKLIKADAPPMLGVSVVDQDFATKHPDEVVKFLVAHIKAVRWGANNPDKVAAILQQHLQMSAPDADALAATWNKTYIATMSQAEVTSLMRMAKIFAGSGNFPGTVSPDVFMLEPFEKAKAIAAKE